MKDVMIDIETMGPPGKTVICQIGAVLFDRNTGATSLELKVNVDIGSCLEAGLTVNGNTIYWWLMQSEEARKSITEGEKLTLYDSLNAFNFFLISCAEVTKSNVEDLSLWGRSPRFDIQTILEAHRAVSLTPKWNIRNEMDVRTIESARPLIKKAWDDKRDSTAHDAIADCKHQINYCSEIWRALNSSEQVKSYSYSFLNE